MVLCCRLHFERGECGDDGRRRQSSRLGHELVGSALGGYVLLNFKTDGVGVAIFGVVRRKVAFFVCFGSRGGGLDLDERRFLAEMLGHGM